MAIKIEHLSYVYLKKTPNEVEALHVSPCDGEIAGVTCAVDDEALIHDEARQAQAVLREVVIDVAVNLVLVDMLGKQLRDDEVDVARVAVVCESACVGHHAAINRHGKMLRQLVETAELPDDAEDKLAG